MSRYIDLNRIEFGVTDACSGRCKHCSKGEHLDRWSHEKTLCNNLFQL